MLITLCKKYSKRSKFIKKINLLYPNVDIEIGSCMGMCKNCKTQPTAIVNGKKIKKKSIKKFIKALDFTTTP
jgi:uncharacterized protein YuzB (UPF0349 family)